MPTTNNLHNEGKLDDIKSHYFWDEENKTRKSSWLITFADLLSLMLTFFVLVYSMSSLTPHKYEDIKSSLQERLNPEKDSSDEAISFTETRSIPKIENKIGKNVDYLYNIVKERTGHLMGRTATITRQDDRVVISLNTDLLFEAGSVTLKEEGIPSIQEICDIIANLENKVEINGHTDPHPISKDHPTYRSNWDLSIDRAAVIAKFVIEAGYPYTLNAFGLSSSRYKELGGGETSQRIDKMARRVDIIIRETTSNTQRTRIHIKE